MMILNPAKLITIPFTLAIGYMMLDDAHCQGYNIARMGQDAPTYFVWSSGFTDSIWCCDYRWICAHFLFRGWIERVFQFNNLIFVQLDVDEAQFM